MRMKRVALALSAAVVTACGSDTTGQLTVRLADAACSDIASAMVWVNQVYVIGGDDPGGPRYVISDQDAEYDLLDLQNGVTALLGTATIPTGAYTQLRLVVDSARVTLRPGLTFTSGATSALLVTPSAQQTGIKVNFSGPVTVDPGQTILVVDFDVCRNFLFTGPGAQPTGVLFRPVLHATVVDVAGSIAGTVNPVAALATIYGILNGDTVASAAADPTTGAYVLQWLTPGTYAVGAKATGYQVATINGVAVAAQQNVTGVDFTLVP